MAEEQIDLTGIFREGIALTVEQLKDEERHSEIVAEVRKEIHGKSVIRRRYSGKDKPKEETKRVHRRVRYLTDNEIRKEYGIMAHPYKTVVENILHLISMMGPITVLGIEEALGKNKNHLSGTVSGMYRRFGPEGAGLIARKMGANQKYLYEAVGEWSVESAVRKQKIKKAADRTFHSRQERWSERACELGEGGGESKERSEVSIEDVLQESLGKALGVDVTVSGRIEVVFGFKKF